ncbi:group II intron reverse transcriptase/maturase [Paenibacillus sp. LHD-38]|uniref:HNH endonuclease n=1 Tax=Paenibacillus sp. LHD-38 TaxID=3072143 RepID=UPI00280CFBFF|nr:group II intron reverse transcriptase/maturase [Paenibacillus sp. LHD-38]MDQ8738588.1 group II intron reverse transcriptase/maturase [Paenibacillus sp. LHD-38]
MYEDKFGIKRRTSNGHIRLFVPKEAWVGKVKNLGALKINNNGEWKILHRGLQPLDDFEILSIYNAEIRGLYNYFMLANNVSVLGKFHYIMSFSMYKTFASKYRTSVYKILNKYKVNGVFSIRYRTKNGIKTSMLYNQGFRQNLNNVQKHLAVDYEPNTWAFKGRSSLIRRLVAETCEWCGCSGMPLEMHHIRKLKDVKGKNKWERKMIERRRKTMALCIKCHDDLHAGRLD